MQAGIICLSDMDINLEVTSRYVTGYIYSVQADLIPTLGSHFTQNYIQGGDVILIFVT